MAREMKTVKNLREELGDLEDDLPVLMASDEEGNGFWHWSGDIGLQRVDELDTRSPTPMDDDASRDLPEAIILWP